MVIGPWAALAGKKGLFESFQGRGRAGLLWTTNGWKTDVAGDARCKMLVGTLKVLVDNV
jgi:hypothetical protein